MAEKVVVTGVGTINAIGNNVDSSWQSAVNGISGIAAITLFDSTDYLVKIAGEVKNYDPTDYMSAKKARRRDRFQQFASIAAKEAIEQSGLEITEANAGRIAIVVSGAIGGIASYENNVLAVNEDGPRKVNPFSIPMLMPNGAAGLIGIDHGIKGSSISVASACASGQDGIGVGWMMVRNGVADVVVTGASDAIITPYVVASFDRINAMSRRGVGDPAPRPFDLERDGLVIAEGAAIIVLESESHALARGASILAEIAGYGSTADAHHITAPHQEGAGGAAAMRQALDSAAANLDEVGYINAHGTGTELNDVIETRAIKSVFGELAYNIPISSTKSMTGHMMGSTGALETIFCVMAIRENVIPPTINYQTPDPDCDLDYTTNEARERPVKVAISNALGFGGHNAVLAVRKYD